MDSNETPWLKETFAGHAVIGVMAQDEVLLKVFSSAESLAIATAFCESLVSQTPEDFQTVVRAVSNSLNQCSSDVIGLQVVRLANGTPVEPQGWFKAPEPPKKKVDKKSRNGKKA